MDDGLVHERLALFNGFGGLASMLVAWSEFVKLDATGAPVSHALTSENAVSEVSLYLTILIGAITFTGSVLAWAKLSEKISGRPFLFKGQQAPRAIPRPCRKSRSTGRSSFR